MNDSPSTDDHVLLVDEPAPPVDDCMWCFRSLQKVDLLHTYLPIVCLCCFVAT